MIYFMDTKTLVREFTKDHSPSFILGCDFVPVSSRIQVHENNDQIVKLQLYSEKVIYSLEEDEEYNYNLVYNYCMNKEQLMLSLCSIVSWVLITGKCIVLLCSPNEFRTGYIKLIARFISDVFHYPVIDYKKEKYKTFTYDPTEVARKIREIEIERLSSFLISDDKHRHQFLLNMTKKEMRKQLKKIDWWYKGMTKKEMRESLMIIFVENCELVDEIVGDIVDK